MNMKDIRSVSDIRQSNIFNENDIKRYNLHVIKW